MKSSESSIHAWHSLAFSRLFSLATRARTHDRTIAGRQAGRQARTDDHNVVGSSVRRGRRRQPPPHRHQARCHRRRRRRRRGSRDGPPTAARSPATTRDSQSRGIPHTTAVYCVAGGCAIFRFKGKVQRGGGLLADSLWSVTPHTHSLNALAVRRRGFFCHHGRVEQDQQTGGRSPSNGRKTKRYDTLSTADVTLVEVQSSKVGFLAGNNSTRVFCGARQPRGTQ